MDQLVVRIADSPEDALDLIEDMAKIRVASRANWAKLWTRISPYLRDAGVDRRKLELAVIDTAKNIHAERREAEKAETLATAKSKGIPTFRRGDNAELAWVLHQELNTADTPLAYDYGKVWRYQPATGHYVEIPDAELSVRLQDWSGAPLLRGEKVQQLGVNSTSTTIDLLKDRLQHDTPPSFFATAKPVISFFDVTLIASNRRVVVIDHGAHHRCDTHLPVDYDPDAQGELLEHYLGTVFEGEDDADEKLELLAQVAGAALFGLTTRIGKKAIMAVGTKGTGKSTFLELVEALVPPSKRSYIPPQQFGEDYHGAGLAGKRLNLVFETPEDDILTEAGIKAIVHGEPIRRREPYGRAIEFRPVATHIFAANALPAAPGTTEAFWDRWAICEFRRKFRDTDREIHDLAKAVIADEFDALAAWAIRGAQSLLDRNGFIVPASSKDALEEWSESRPVARFARECLVTGEAHFSFTDELYKQYQEWAPRHGFSSRMNVVTFGRRLADIVEKKRTMHGRGFKARFDPSAVRGDPDLPF